MNKVLLNSKLITSLAEALYVSPSVIMSASGIANSTWYRIMQQPGIITIQQLLGIANGMHIPVRRFFYIGKMLYLGRRDEYITEPYLECRYDAEALQQFVANSPSATWKQAARETGVTRDNLRNSLLGARRTPVTRFLDVCNIFEINPFTILIDPNPEVKANGTPRTSVSSPLTAEVEALRQQVHHLSDTVADLTSKYDDLLEKYELLLKQSSSPLHLAADDPPKI